MADFITFIINLAQLTIKPLQSIALGQIAIKRFKSLENIAKQSKKNITIASSSAEYEKQLSDPLSVRLSVCLVGI